MQIEKQDNEYIVSKPTKSGSNKKQNIAKVMIDDENIEQVIASIYLWSNTENRFNAFASTVENDKNFGDIHAEEVLDFV